VPQEGVLKESVEVVLVQAAQRVGQRLKAHHKENVEEQLHGCGADELVQLAQDPVGASRMLLRQPRLFQLVAQLRVVEELLQWLEVNRPGLVHIALPHDPGKIAPGWAQAEQAERLHELPLVDASVAVNIPDRPQVIDLVQPLGE